MAIFPVSGDLDATVMMAQTVSLTNNQDVYVVKSQDDYCLTYDMSEAGEHHILVPAGGGAPTVEVHGQIATPYIAGSADLDPNKAHRGPTPVRAITITARPHGGGWSGLITYVNDATLTTVSCRSPLAALVAVRDELTRIGHKP